MSERPPARRDHAPHEAQDDEVGASESAGSFTRRAMILGAAAAGAAALIRRPYNGNERTDGGATEEEEGAPTVGGMEAAEAAPPHSFTLDPPLAGMEMPEGSLFARYFGRHGRLPDELSVSYPRNLSALWREKLARERGEPHALSAIVAESRLADYAERWETDSLHTTTLPRLQDDLDALTERLRNELDPRTLARLYGLSEREREVLAAELAKLDGTMFLSYSMTELMPSSDGAKNARVYDFLLQTAGEDFLLATPALGDTQVSFGPFQFTPLAFLDTENPLARYGMRGARRGHAIRRGASLANLALSLDARLEVSDVTDLYSFADHGTAAFLFAVNNLARAARALGREPHLLNAFAALGARELGTFLAASHNEPSAALVVLERALAEHESSYAHAANMLAKTLERRHHPEHAGNTSFERVRRVASYARKTEHNYDILTRIGS